MKNFKFKTGLTVHQLSDFWVRAELVKMVWDEGLQKNSPKVVQSMVEEFSHSGFDLSIPKGAVYIREEQKGKASLLIAVKNVGDKATPGTVKVSVQVPIKNRKSVMDNWVEFRYDLNEVLPPGRIAYTDPKIVQAYIAPPEKGEPDWDNMLVKAWVDCKKGGLDAFDKDLSNNYFYGKSRITTVNPKYK